MCGAPQICGRFPASARKLPKPTGLGNYFVYHHITTLPLKRLYLNCPGTEPADNNLMEGNGHAPK